MEKQETNEAINPSGQATSCGSYPAADCSVTKNGAEAYKMLVRKYADGRKICNCGEGYLSPCACGIDEHGIDRTDMLACNYGCSANKIYTRDEIARRVVAELSQNT